MASWTDREKTSKNLRKAAESLEEVNPTLAAEVTAVADKVDNVVWGEGEAEGWKWDRYAV